MDYFLKPLIETGVISLYPINQVQELIKDTLLSKIYFTRSSETAKDITFCNTKLLGILGKFIID
ncbi:hypothetical protein ACH24_04480 [Francisella persica ATCC VR-331]|uniref:Uncharacterized protein n=1 Tax=Francisella persica ATCC VR-331 TaxID=1086726 RepID=A0AAC8VE29_9GAMM|nr:hypothetical protein ACH24_04480 [Francisella persica ATCC VR-331]ANH77158.1 hypothetical protein FSC845_00595 [Francisella persica ATCC VR-331]